jgi:glycosyltransferase involved in cell wall biosynthesis
MQHGLHVHAVHLLNDLSGSPLVFAMELESRVKKGEHVTLYTSEGPGFLSNIPGITYKTLPYRWSPSALRTLWAFVTVQLYLFVHLVRRVKKNDVVYVNTLLPFGALLAGRVNGAQVIQHLHEVSVRPALLMKLLCWVSEHCCNEQIFVSDYLRGCFSFRKPSQRVVHNRLPEAFEAQAKQCDGSQRDPQRYKVLMLCSLKAYKGVYVMAELARRLPQVEFNLLLNASDDERTRFVHEVKPGSNLILHPATRNTHPFYAQADMVVNLSLPDQWIETFGMTLLEARAYGLPVIAPPVGGPAEIVIPGVHGWLISAYDTEQLEHVIAAQAEAKAAKAQAAISRHFSIQ